MVIALILNSRVPWRGLLSAIMLLPWIVPEIVTALAWKSIYDPLFGGLNPILQGLGIIDRPLGWLSDPQMAMGSVIAVNVWKGIPFFTLLLLAGLKAIDTEQYEAAEVDGANAVQRFRYVTLPGLRYVILVVLLLTFISTFNQFGLIFLMTGGGPGGATRLYSILAYEKAIGSLQYGPGSAIALSVAPLMALLIWLLARYMRHDDRATSRKRAQQRRTAHRTVLGRALDAFSRSDLPAFRSAAARHGAVVARRQAARDRGADAARLRAEASREDRHRPPAAGTVPDHGLRALPLLLGDRHLVQDHAADQPAEVDLLAQPGDDRAVPLACLDTPFLTWLRNSVLIAAASTVVSIVIAALAAYALSRLKFLGAGLLTTCILITYLLPGTLIFIPLYQTLSDLGLINSYGALIVTYPTFLVPFATWVLIGYFRSIPVDLEEAAMIDGASRFYAFWRITLPLADAGFAVGHPVRLHQCLERVPLRLRVHHQRVAEDAAHRAAVHGGGRHPALGQADGGFVADGDTGGGTLHVRPALPGRRLDDRRRKGLNGRGHS